MRYIVLLGGLAVTACGGSGGRSTPPIEVGPAIEDIGGRVATVSPGPGAGEFTAETDGLTRSLEADPTFDNGTFIAARGVAAAGSDGFYLSETDTSIALLYRPDPDDVSGGPSVTLTRIGDSTVPTRGMASVTGDYTALVQGGTASDDVDAIIDGIATFDVDFAAQTISGRITDRVARNPADNSTMFDDPVAIADLILSPAVISDTGTFTTSTSGGNITIGTFDTFEADGTYAGLIADDGNEVIAGVVVEYNLGAFGLLEVGAAAAGH